MEIIQKTQRQLTAIAVFFLAALSAAAQNVKLTISDLFFEPGQTKEVSIYLENDVPAGRVIGGDIIFPEGFQFTNLNSNPDAAGIYMQRTSRCPSALTVQSSTFRENKELAGGTLRFLLSSAAGKKIAAGSGAILKFEVTAPANFSAIQAQKVTLKGITIGGIGDENTSMTFDKEVPLYDSNFIVTFSAEDISATPTQVSTVTVSMDNTMGVCALEGIITLPEGLSFVKNAEDEYCTAAERVASLHYITTTEYGNAGNQVMFLVDAGTPVDIVGNSGAIFTFNVKGDASLAKNALIKITDIYGSTIRGDLKDIDAITINVTNPDVDAIATAEQAIAALKATLSEAETALAEYAEDIQTQLAEKLQTVKDEVDAIKLTASTSKDNGTAAVDLEALLTRIDNASNDAKALVDEAAQIKKEQEEAAAKKAEDDQFAVNTTAITTLRTDLAAAKDAVAKAGIADAQNEELAAIETAITDLNAKIEANHAAGKSVEAKEDVDALVKAVTDRITAINDAVAAANNATQNTADKAALAEVETAMSAANEAIATYDESVQTLVAEAKVAAEQAIADASAAIAASFEAGTSVADKAANAALITAASEAVTKLAADAKAAQDKFLADAAAAANEAQNTVDKAALAEVETAMSTANETIATYDESVQTLVAEAKAAAEQAIADASAAIAASFEAGTSVADKAANAALIAAASEVVTKLAADAKAAQDKFLADAAAAANEAQNTADKAALAEVETAMSTANETIATYDESVQALVAEAKAAAEQAIADASAAIAASFEAGTSVADKDANAALIAAASEAVTKLVDDAKAAQAEIELAKQNFVITGEFTSLADIADKKFAIIEKESGKALFGKDAQNLGYDIYTNAFVNTNSGYLFQLETPAEDAEDETIANCTLFRLITPAGEPYSVWGNPGYLNSQPASGNCSFILGLTDKNGQDIKNGAVWDAQYVEGKGFTLLNKGTGLYLNSNGPANNEEPVYWTLASIAFKNAITVAETANGTVTTDAVKAIEGTTVTITATPAEGYKLESISVMAGENDVEVSEDMTFVMPASDVTVSATFVEDVVVPDPNLIEIAQTVDADQDLACTKTENEGYTQYNFAGDISVAFKMLNVDVKDCDYVIIKFAEPTPAGLSASFFNGIENESIPEGVTEWKNVIADNTAVVDGIMPQIALLTIFTGEGKSVKVEGVYKHKVASEPELATIADMKLTVAEDAAIDEKDKTFPIVFSFNATLDESVNLPNGMPSGEITYTITAEGKEPIQGSRDFDPTESSKTIYAEGLDYESEYTITINSLTISSMSVETWETSVLLSKTFEDGELAATFTTNIPYIELADGDYLIKNVATGKYLGGANSWGTQASLVDNARIFTLTKLENGKYNFDSHAYNKADMHFLNGEGWTDSNATPLAVYSVENGAAFGANPDACYAVPAEGSVLATDVKHDDVNALWEFIPVADAVAALEAGEATDATFLLKDASISRNLYNSAFEPVWEGDAFSKGGPNENQCAEKWGGNSEIFDVHQTINVPNGIYKVTVQGFYRYNNTTDNTNDIAIAAHADGTEVIYSFLYANEKEVALASIADDEAAATLAALPFSMNEASAAFAQGLYNNSVEVEVTDGTLTIGVKKTEHLGIDWTLWDNFTITRIVDQPSGIGVDGVNAAGKVNRKVLNKGQIIIIKNGEQNSVSGVRLY